MPWKNREGWRRKFSTPFWRPRTRRSEPFWKAVSKRWGRGGKGTWEKGEKIAFFYSVCLKKRKKEGIKCPPAFIA
ncbi:hypothetical protein HMPREF0262_00337 [Clostridium sp. ATCC 29733]|nr:hypothetical protein HMPREF0262_00337 [Clostridium sp. ATCC 29733]